MQTAVELWHAFLHALKNLLPILLVVALFQLLLFQTIPDNILSMFLGLMIVAVGIALFLHGLELGVFPIGKSLANQFSQRGSVITLLIFGFCIGFSAVIAEPALIAVAEQAAFVSDGRIQALSLRLVVAISVGAVISLGILRTLLGHPIHWYLIIGYILVVVITWFAPPEIVGLAYDSGGVTTNIVTVPLIAAIGIGLANSIQGRQPLRDGFGLVALAVMVPMLSVQIYGIVVYTFGSETAVTLTETAEATTLHPILVMVLDLLSLLQDVLPILLVILFFQYLVLRRGIRNPMRLVIGFVMVLLGLYAFIVGLKMGLFPVGESMARQLILGEHWFFVYVFAFGIGFATTLAEPALIAIGQQAEQAAPGRLKGSVIRLIVALGVAIGITIGVHRIISGDSIHYYIIAGYVLVIALLIITPKYIVALAFDLGGVTTSEVTVPLVTALGIGLATHIDGRSPLLDGFGLIAFASIFPIVTVMIYAIVMEALTHKRRSAP
jgi:hypothetical protein